MSIKSDHDRWPNSELEALILSAFEAAAASGKPGWRMTAAVLKNRLLSITNGDFSEVKYGAASFGELLDGLPNLLQVDKSQTPPMVTIRGARPATPSESQATTRIRPDLWDAMLDYSSGRKYVWSIERGRAEVSEGEEERYVLPTADPTILNEWRQHFVDSLPNRLETEEETQTRVWARDALPTRVLPARLQPLWNAFLKQRVRDRLETWFAENQLSAPPDLIIKGAVSAAAGAELQDSRTRVIDIVRGMTDAELRALQLPAGAVIRWTRRRNG